MKQKFTIFAICVILAAGAMAGAQVTIESAPGGNIQIGGGGTSNVPYPVDLTNCGANSAVCDGSTDDHVKIQACIEANPAVFIPTSNLGAIQCNLGTVGIHTGTAFGYTAIYGNGQFFGYTGTGAAVDMTAGGATLATDLTIDMTGSSASAIAFSLGPGSILINGEDSAVPFPDGDSIKMDGGRVTGYTGTGFVQISLGIADGLDFTDPTTSAMTMTTASVLKNSTICGPGFINGGVGGATAILENDTFCTDNSGDPALTISDRSNVSLTGVTLALNGSSIVALSLPTSPTLLAINGNVVITDPSETFTGDATSGFLTVQVTDGTALTLAYPSARRGTFTCTGGGTITVPNTVAVSSSSILVTLNSAAGTPATPTMLTPGDGTSFSMGCGALDTSTYNYYVTP